MPPACKPVFTVQVRELVEFVLRRGDLGGTRDFVGRERALAGTRAHQRLQRSRPAGYEKEIPVACEVEAEALVLRVQGRIDGLLACSDAVVLEEIKSVTGRWDGVADPLHWAQAKCYGFMYAQAHAKKQLVLQLTYVDLHTSELREFKQDFGVAELSAFFNDTTAVYLDWISEQQRWCRRRDQSIRSLPFPFPRYRVGQRELAVAAYRAIARSGRLFAEAPTGIGKTVSVLFPALKAMGEGKLERIFYLTARTSGRSIAEKALSDLRQAGLRVRTLTLTAKEKICVQEGQPCDPSACPLAQGYYDRHKAAMRDALSRENISRPVVEAVSREHQVCPFELSLDVSSWADVVVCDYNYVFDPRVYLRRHFSEKAGDTVFLVDEAHNLVDRGRDMFSADLDRRHIQDARKATGKALPRCTRALSRLSSVLRRQINPGAPENASPEIGSPSHEPDLFTSTAPPRPSSGISNEVREQRPDRERRDGTRTSRELPAELLPPLDRVLDEAEAWLAQNQAADFRQTLLELYFRLLTFRRTAELYDHHYVTLFDNRNQGRIRLFCLDPSSLLRQALARGKAAVFFSATLAPMDYYRALLGGSPEDSTLRLASPFAPEHLTVLVQGRIATRFKMRDETLGDVAQAVGELVQGRAGNYLVYVPSYQYLTALQERFRAAYPEMPILVQRPGMSESERDAFLAAFAVEHRQTLVGFAVLGGVFGEGIDLVGERLIGAIVVGVGLPQLCVERDLIRDYFQEHAAAGFEYAYVYPGMNRVLQATGRVIRSETDRGVILLIDTRFKEAPYRRLFPPWWQPVQVRDNRKLKETLGRIWAPIGSRTIGATCATKPVG